MQQCVYGLKFELSVHHEQDRSGLQGGTHRSGRPYEGHVGHGTADCMSRTACALHETHLGLVLGVLQDRVHDLGAQ